MFFFTLQTYIIVQILGHVAPTLDVVPTLDITPTLDIVTILDIVPTLDIGTLL